MWGCFDIPRFKYYCSDDAGSSKAVAEESWHYAIRSSFVACTHQVNLMINALLKLRYLKVGERRQPANYRCIEVASGYRSCEISLMILRKEGVISYLQLAETRCLAQMCFASMLRCRKAYKMFGKWTTNKIHTLRFGR
jgi:hypothetical protein